MQTTAELTDNATQAVVDFVKVATGSQQLTEAQVKNALLLVAMAADECRNAFNASIWHKAQPVHAFEAMNCVWKGTNHRWPPLSLNLHFSERADTSILIGTPEDMPLTAKYFVKRVIADAAFSSDGV